MWDSTQPEGAKEVNNGIAVDTDGNPAFVDLKNRINWKKNGKWVQLKGCTQRINFGGDGILYKTDCDHYVHKYYSGDRWARLGS